MASRQLAPAAVLLVAGLALTAGSGCYHYTFELRAPAPSGAPTPVAEQETVTYSEQVPTYLNGFVGNPRLNTSRYCSFPLRTELTVTALDVLVSIATLLIYTPHTLSVTCEAATAIASKEPAPASPTR